MTVCIAAACRDEAGEPAVVLCCDKQGTKDWVSSDNVKKIQWIGDQFAVMLAGDLGSAKELLSLLAYELVGIKPQNIATMFENMAEQFQYTRGTADEDLRVSRILTTIREVIGDAKRRSIEEYVVNRWGMGYTQLRNEHQKLPELEYQDTMRYVSACDIGVSLIFCSLLEDEACLIFVDGNECKAKWQSNYVVIGSGYPLAESILAQYDYSEESSVKDAITAAFHAKFASERSPDVGRSTVVEVMTRAGRKTVPSDVLDKLRAYFERDIPQIDLPSGLLEEPGGGSDKRYGVLKLYAPKDHNQTAEET